VRDWAREEGLAAYSQADNSGYLRHLIVREGRNTGQVLVQLVTAPGEKFEQGYFVDVLRKFPEVRSVHWAVNDRPAEVTNLPAALVWGEPSIEEELCGLRFRIRPHTFVQPHHAIAESCMRSRAAPRSSPARRPSGISARGGIRTVRLSSRRTLTVWGSRSPRSPALVRSRTPS
jgi:23S rRNA (uracil1939-C5)-methyltransferase